MRSILWAIARCAPFTASAARQRGITADALANHERFSQISRGIWVDSESLTDVPAPHWADHRWLETWVQMTGIRQLYPDLAADHLTAARLYGLPLPNRVSDIATLAPLLSLNELVTIGDAAIGRQASGPYITRERLREKIAALPRVAHRRKVRKALTLMRETVDSPKESWLRLWLIDRGFQEPVVHPAVCSPIDDCVPHSDLGYPELRIAIEYEGDQHRISPAQYAHVIRRRELLEAEGWALLRVAKRSDMASFAKLLTHYIAERSRSR